MNRQAVLALIGLVLVAGGAGFYVFTSGGPDDTVALTAPDATASATQPAAPVAAPASAPATAESAVQAPVEAVAAAAPARAPAPQNGPATLEEKHGDWTVSCTNSGAARRCSFGQGLFAAETGQRVLSLELGPADADGNLRGTLFAPFSLSFEAGATLSIGAQKLAGPLPFLTCVQQGCVVPVSFDRAAMAALGAGEALTFSAVAVSGARPIALELSLDGFAAAAERTATLVQ